MDEQKEAVTTLHHIDDLVGHGTKARVPFHLPHQGIRELAEDVPAHGGISGAGKEGHQPYVRIVLPSQAGEHLGEPLARFMDDHDRHNGWGGVGRALLNRGRHDVHILLMTHATHHRAHCACKS